LVITRGLSGVADHENDGIPTVHRKRVVALVVIHQAHQLLELVEIELGLLLLVGQADLVRHIDILISCRVGGVEVGP
jgi:hypothetical protein